MTHLQVHEQTPGAPDGPSGVAGELVLSAEERLAASAASLAAWEQRLRDQEAELEARESLLQEREAMGRARQDEQARLGTRAPSSRPRTMPSAGPSISTCSSGR